MYQISLCLCCVSFSNDTSEREHKLKHKEKEKVWSLCLRQPRFHGEISALVLALASFVKTRPLTLALPFSHFPPSLETRRPVLLLTHVGTGPKILEVQKLWFYVNLHIGLLNVYYISTFVPGVHRNLISTLSKSLSLSSRLAINNASSVPWMSQESRVLFPCFK